MRQFDGEEKSTAMESLHEVLHDMRDKYLEKGGSASKVIEFLFIIARVLGLKMPFRACSLAALNRELWIHQLRPHRNLWSETRTTTIFGPDRNMERVFRSKNSKYNGYVEYCGKSKMSGTEAAPSWKFPHHLGPISFAYATALLSFLTIKYLQLHGYPVHISG